MNHLLFIAFLIILVERTVSQVQGPVVIPFWLILLELLIQNNIEFFTFVGFRALSTTLSKDFNEKVFNTLIIIFLFIVIFCTFSSYSIYYHRYKKLARYFLVNMYRFPSSYILMTIAFGVRPFLKGIIHASLHDHWVLQIWLLIEVEVVTVMFEIFLDNHKSRFILGLDLLYHVCLVLMNLLLFCKY